jgi:hypothetical protein
MPYRSAAWILVGLGGLVAVAGLVLIGIDVYAASRRGPRWKRRLLGAGLAVLGLLGLGGGVREYLRPTCYDMAPMPFAAPSLQRLEVQASVLYQLTSEGRVDPDTAGKALAAAEAALVQASRPEVLGALSPEERERASALIGNTRTRIDQVKARLDAGPLGDSDEWKQLVATWAEAEEVASGRRGQYPFSEAGRKELLARLERLGADAAALAGRGLLSQAEAGLLAMEAQALAKRVGRFRPTELRGATCYKPMDFWPAREGAGRLAARLPLLERLAAQEQVSRPALRKLLAAVEADLATLSDEKELATWADRAARAEAEKTRDAVRGEVEKLRKLLDSAPQPAAVKPEK